MRLITGSNQSIESSWIGKVTIKANGDIETKVFNEFGQWKMTILDDQNLNRLSVSTAGSTDAWWGDFEDCVGQMNAPTDSNVANVIFGILANAVTYGTYSGATLVMCAGVATGSSW